MGGNYPSGGLLGMGDIMTGAPGGAGAAAGQPAGDPATDPALGAPASPYILKGAPLVEAPDMSKALMAAAQGVFAANQAGQGFSGWMAGGLGGYSQNLELQRQRSNDQRRQQLSDMALMSEIEQRQMTQAAMTNKVRALQRLKTMNPTLADQIDIDPEGVSAAMTAALVPKYEKVGLGDKIVKMQDGKATVVSDPMNDAIAGATPPGSNPNLNSQIAGNPDVMPDGSPAAPTAPADPYDVNGPAYAGIPPVYKATVREMLMGNAPNRLLSNPSVGPLLETWAQQVDPTFDRTQMSARQKTAEDFSTDGQSGQTLTSIGAAAQHVADANAAFKKMKNGKYNALNWMKNEWAQTHDDPTNNAIKEFQTAIGNYAPEGAKIATGSSSPAQGEIQSKREPFSLSNGPEAMQAALNESASLIHGKAKELIYSYKRNMGGRLPPGLPVFSPDTMKSFKDLGVDLSDIIPPAAPSASAASGRASPQAVATPQSPVVDQIAKTIDAMTPKSGQAAAGNAITAPGAPGLKLPAVTPAPPVKGAKLAPDGNWYVPDPARPGKFLMVK